ncbi:MAG: hypothetical protein JO197_04625 [Acidobacteria bacterium]|nr:hypothetical protein [Acidobacteriota bacterium]MBV9475261.1 hypothetical protein [Acidobacteriota bacterium]
MGEVRLFQICYEGDLTVEVSHVMRRLGAEPNFDQSWQVFLPEGRHAAPLVRYLRANLGADAKLLVASAQFTNTRDFLLVRHSLTPGADYAELHDALARLGTVVDLPFESTFVIQSDDRTDVHTLGAALGELCPDESLMVTGISHDWAYCNSGVSRMFVADEADVAQFRTF